MTKRVEWAAGFFEGEGNAYIKKLRGESYRRLTLSVSQVDRKALDKFRRIVGVGVVRGPYGPYQNNRQPHYQWMVHGPDALKLAKVLAPHLCGKRKQVDSKVREYNTWLKSA